MFKLKTEMSRFRINFSWYQINLWRYRNGISSQEILMKEKTTIDKQHQHKDENREINEQEGYPPYPAAEDIYGKYQKDRKIDPEDPSNIKRSSDNNKPGKYNEKDFDEDVTGGDLDIPGSELNDELEIIGNEDEENNYYSLGGDDHNDLDENYIERQD